MLGLIAAGEVDTPVFRRRHGVERTALVPPVDVVGHRHRAVAVVQKGNQTFRILVCQRAEQHGIHHAENRRIRTDPQGQRDHCNSRKPRSAQQAAHSIAHILEPLLDPQKGARLAMQFLGLFDAAVSAAGGQPGILRSQSAALEVVRQHGEVAFDFAGQLAFGAASAEQVRKSGKPATHVRLPRKAVCPSTRTSAASEWSPPPTPFAPALVIA